MSSFRGATVLVVLPSLFTSRSGRHRGLYFSKDCCALAQLGVLNPTVSTSRLLHKHSSRDFPGEEVWKSDESWKQDNGIMGTASSMQARTDMTGSTSSAAAASDRPKSQLTSTISHTGNNAQWKRHHPAPGSFPASNWPLILGHPFLDQLFGIDSPSWYSFLWHITRNGASVPYANYM